MFFSKDFFRKRQKLNVEKIHQMNAMEKMELVRKKRNRDCPSILSEYLYLPPKFFFLDLHNLQDFCLYLGMKKGFTISMEEIQRVREFIQISKQMFHNIENCYLFISPDDQNLVFDGNTLSKIKNYNLIDFHTTVYAFLVLHQDIDRFVFDIRNKYCEAKETINSTSISDPTVKEEKADKYVVLSHPNYLLILRELFFEENYKKSFYLKKLCFVELSEFVEFLVNVILYPHFYFLNQEHRVALHQLKLASKSLSFPENALKKDWLKRIYDFLHQISECDASFLNPSCDWT